MTTFLKLSPHRLGGLFALGIASSAFLAACSSLENDSKSVGLAGDCFYGCSDEAPGMNDAGGEPLDDTAEDAGRDALPLNALCGQGSCHPDQPSSCVGSKLELELEGGDEASEREADEIAEADDDADAGSDDADALVPPSPEDGSPGELDADADSGNSGLVPNLACHVTPSASGPVRACEAAGMGGVDAPCMRSADCEPGLACVGPEHGGICRPYCCGDPEDCPSQTFCDTRELRDDAKSDSPAMVPVCVPAMPCKLLEHEPCASLGLVCGIVRSDGTTSCVSPGTGKLEEPCPCAFGYVCAQSQNKCLKLCHVSLSSAECPGGTCQGGTEELPQGFGVCVGGYQDAG